MKVSRRRSSPALATVTLRSSYLEPCPGAGWVPSPPSSSFETETGPLGTNLWSTDTVSRMETAVTKAELRDARDDTRLSDYHNLPK